MSDKRFECCGEPRGCEEYEIGAVIDLANYVFMKAYGELYWYGHNYAFMFSRMNRENIRVIKADNRIVSSATIMPSTIRCAGVEFNAAGISTVMTHPDYQGKGYNSMLMQDCIKKMKADGIEVVIINTSIYNFYRKFGWENAAAEHVFKLDSGNTGLLPGLEKHQPVRCTKELHLYKLNNLYNSCTIGARRTPEEFFLKVLGKPDMEVYCAEEGNDIIGYVVFLKNTVMEHAGDARITAGLIKAVFEKRVEDMGNVKSTDPKSQFEFGIRCPPSNSGLCEFLDSRGFPKKAGYLGMLRILNLDKVLEKLNYPGISILYEDENEVVLTKDGKEQRFTRGMLSKLIFGPEKVELFGQYYPCPEFYQWPVDMV